MESVGQTRTAEIFRHGSGAMIVRIRPGAVQSVEDAKENIRVTVEASGGKRVPLLTDIRGATPLDAETRHYYSGRQLTDFFTALAVLVPIGAFGKMFGNVYLRVAKPGIPAQLFNSEEEALHWLKSHTS